MEFHLERSDATSEALRSIVRGQVERASALLAAREEVSDASVHDARKAIKRARAALRLARYSIAPRQFKRTNFTLRDAARPLTSVRDTKVLLDTLSSLEKHYGETWRKSLTAPIARKIEAERTAVQRELDELHATLAQTRAALKRARQQVDGWAIVANDWAVLGPGVQRIYRDGRHAYHKALQQRTDECLHEWRKHVKHLWHALQILQPMRPKALGQLADDASRLSDLLGDDHDLSMLRHHVLAHSTARSSKAAALIDERRAKLQKRAFTLGERMFADRPKRFQDQLAKQWSGWRKRSAVTPQPRKRARRSA